jgi:hypothetical protein
MMDKFPYTVVSVLTPDGHQITGIPNPEDHDVQINGLRSGVILISLAEAHVLQQVLNTLYPE